MATHTLLVSVCPVVLRPNRSIQTTALIPTDVRDVLIFQMRPIRLRKKCVCRALIGGPQYKHEMTVDLPIFEPALDQRSVGSTVFGLLYCFKAKPKSFEFAMGRLISSALYKSPLPSELGTKRIQKAP